MATYQEVRRSLTDEERDLLSMLISRRLMQLRDDFDELTELEMHFHDLLTYLSNAVMNDKVRIDA